MSIGDMHRDMDTHNDRWDEEEGEPVAHRTSDRMTGGPWQVERPKPSERWVTGIEPETGNRVLVAACETDADAQAIAALPELVEACRSTLAYMRAAGYVLGARHPLVVAVAKLDGGA